jgi:hypothetical protein
MPDQALAIGPLGTRRSSMAIWVPYESMIRGLPKGYKLSWLGEVWEFHGDHWNFQWSPWNSQTWKIGTSDQPISNASFGQS